MPKREITSKPAATRARRGDDAVLRFRNAQDTDEDLPFTVELWTLTRHDVERVLGRAASAALAHAIFVAAQTEHLGRRITLRRGPALLSESG